MNLPAADRAFIQPEKLRDYLLSTEHPSDASRPLSSRGWVIPARTGAGFKWTYRKSLDLTPPWSVKRVPLGANTRSMVSCEDRPGEKPA
jgi:hypothetical protein